MLSRSNFMRMLGLAVVGRCVPGGVPRQPRAAGGEEVSDTLRREFVFDGAVSIGTRRGQPTLEAGSIKVMSGISLGNHTVNLTSIPALNQRCADFPQALMRIDRVRDIQTAITSNRYGLVYYMQQGFELRGSVEPLSLWKAQGLRCLQLTYTDNALGGGSESDDRPLTPLGLKVVAELNRLRMVVDVSHSGRRTTLDAAQASTFPITANHANAIELTPHRRNKTDEELKAIAATGGVVAVTAINRFLLSNIKAPATITDFVNHIDYLVGKIGIDHVGISSDSYLDGSQRYDVDYSDPLLCSIDRWRHVSRYLSEKGYKKEHIQKILGLNFKRVYEKVLDQ